MYDKTNNAVDRQYINWETGSPLIDDEMLLPEESNSHDTDPEHHEMLLPEESNSHDTDPEHHEIDYRTDIYKVSLNQTVHRLLRPGNLALSGVYYSQAAVPVHGHLEVF